MTEGIYLTNKHCHSSTEPLPYLLCTILLASLRRLIVRRQFHSILYYCQYISTALDIQSVLLA